MTKARDATSVLRWLLSSFLILTACTAGSAADDEAPDAAPCSTPDCQPLTEAEEEALSAAVAILDGFEEHSAWIDDFPLSRDTLLAELEGLVRGRGRRGALEAQRHALLAMPVGHDAINPSSDYSACQTEELYWQGRSRLGACARPNGDDFVITHVLPGNPLELSPGDRITAIGDDSGDAMGERVLGYPACGNAAASVDGRRIMAATSALGAIPVGETVTIDSPEGVTHEVSVPATTPADLDCRDPMGRNWSFNARSTLRDDGLAVIRVPRFLPLGLAPDATYAEQYEAMRSAVLTAFQQVADEASAIIWDMRANVGGLTLVGLEIVEGMRGARSTTVAHCGRRIPGSSPVALDPATEFDYEIAPAPESAFAFDGPTVVLVDGFAGSAADYFVWAVREATDVPIVGTGTFGAYGGIGPSIEVGRDPVMTVSIDPYRCDDGSGAALETRTIEPDLRVEQDPMDLAAGVDTQLEAAISLVESL